MLLRRQVWNSTAFLGGCSDRLPLNKKVPFSYYNRQLLISFYSVVVMESF